MVNIEQLHINSIKSVNFALLIDLIYFRRRSLYTKELFLPRQILYLLTMKLTSKTMYGIEISGLYLKIVEKTKLINQTI